jgi:hypothetical protein
MTAAGELVADAAVPRRAWPLAVGVGLAMAVAASAVTLLLTRSETTTAPAPVLRYSLTLPTRTPINISEVSPDGRFVVIAGRDDNGNRRIWLRALDGTEFTTLASAVGADYPFWSPDSKDVAFFDDPKLFRVSMSGGAPRQIADAGDVFERSTATGSFATWGADGAILFGAADGIYRVSASGGPVERVSAAAAPQDAAPWSNFHWPQWLPGQRGVLFSTRSATAGFAINNVGALFYQPLGGTAIQVAGVRSRAVATSHGVLVGRENSASDAADLRLHQVDTVRRTTRTDHSARSAAGADPICRCASGARCRGRIAILAGRTVAALQRRRERAARGVSHSIAADRRTLAGVPGRRIAGPLAARRERGVLPCQRRHVDDSRCETRGREPPCPGAPAQAVRDRTHAHHQYGPVRADRRRDQVPAAPAARQ